MYHNEGDEKYRFMSASTTFPGWAAVNGNTVRVGIWSYNTGEYRNFKVVENAVTKPWNGLSSLVSDPSNFERSSTSRISLNTATGEVTASGRSHMLSIQEYALPLYVECELKTTLYTASLFLGNDIHDTDLRMNDNTTSVKNNVNLSTSTYEARLGLEIKDDTGVIQTSTNANADPNSEKANYRTFSLYVSKDVMVAYIDYV